MKNKLLSMALIAITSFSFAQSGKAVWKATVKNPTAVTFANKQSIVNPRLFQLDVNQLQQSLTSAPKRFASNAQSNVIVSFPNAQGQLEQFRVKESTNMDPALAARYPNIKSYIGQGVNTHQLLPFISVCRHLVCKQW
jgi:hypothetical protein